MFEQELNIYWKKVIDTIQDGIMIVDTRGTIVSANRALEKITGYTKDELLGKSCAVLKCNVFEYARKNTDDHWCVLFKTGEMKKRKCTFIKKGGIFIHVLKNASLLKDAQGKIMGAVETITDISEIMEKDSQIEAFRRELRSENGFHGILGASVPMQNVFDLMKNASRSDAPIIIFGESGTGKGLVAKVIHEISLRKKEPFIKVNCASFNESLLESELFGHVKGSYTGALKDRVGRFEAAQNGIIFLDEIGDLQLSTQIKLLRVLEEKVIERVGDNTPVHINSRIISATNQNLNKLVKEGYFREDLFYRINVIPIHIIPLRDRIDDIPILAESFFRRNRLKTDKKIDCISNETMRLLMSYSWPGNVRELRSTLEYAFVTCQNSMIEPNHLPPSIHQEVGIQQEIGIRKIAPVYAVDKQDAKKRRLIEALKRTNGNQSMAAAIMGVSRVTVWNQMKKFNVDPKQYV
ncbi:MAG: sigma 54-interacting transcriptional regulator [Deltaproteobacteria bacterium]|nr:sigma 54-interacting transcriptional regulator [Deltaproteobacteria bacterium]